MIWRREARFRLFVRRAKCALLFGAITVFANLLSIPPASAAIFASPGSPVFGHAVFYDGLMEFSTRPPLAFNGSVHCNSNIYVGPAVGSSLTFFRTVTAVGTISAPPNNGENSYALTTYYIPPMAFVSRINLPLPVGNAHSMIDMPSAGENPIMVPGSTRLFNQAHVLILVSNTTVTTIFRQNINGNLPALDPAPIVNTYSTNVLVLNTNLIFLTLTNRFWDARELKTNLTTQIDVNRYAQWLATNTQVTGKFPTGSSTYPTILYVADNRTASVNERAVVRLKNGTTPPRNGGLGFSVATPNPLYVWGNYNCTNAAHLGTTNTSSTVPCAFYSDAITLLSAQWSDRNSLTNPYTTGDSAWQASLTNTVNAGILAGIVPTTGQDDQHFSGGVQNLPRLLEDWTGRTLWLNGSLVNLFNSTRATGQFYNPGLYYDPPVYRFNHDPNFRNAILPKPPGTPGEPPFIVVQPQSRIAVAGSTVSFNVVISSGLPVSYLWLWASTNILANGTNATLTFTNVTVGQAGGYSVSILNAAGVAIGSNVVLTVYPTAAATLSSPTPAGNNQIQFNITGVPGFNYALQVSSNLVNWDSLITNVSPFIFVTTNVPEIPERFYRARYLP